MHRDTLAAHVGHHPMTMFFAVAENESIGRVKYNLMQASMFSLLRCRRRLPLPQLTVGPPFLLAANVSTVRSTGAKGRVDSWLISDACVQLVARGGAVSAHGSSQSAGRCADGCCPCRGGGSGLPLARPPGERAGSPASYCTRRAWL